MNIWYSGVLAVIGMGGILLLESGVISLIIAGPAIGVSIGGLWSGCMLVRKGGRS
jgi:hypothetical protein